MKLSEIPIETILLGLLAVGVFAAVFFFSALFPKPTDATLQGVHVVATGNAQEQLRGILSRNNPVVFELQLFQGNSSKNTALSIASAQIVSNLVHRNVNASVFGSIDGNASINCVAETNFCSGADVTLRIGSFNGMRITDDRVDIEGTEDFYNDPQTLEVLSGVFGLAANKG
ncbi:hypothetical protein HY572_02405 [Candidatus Micrarchaeota archaeon]|nr:hypothetical protein [Candidatus Micrarchaeota archaeon]